jgi:tetratricopeptide (TPR) repeat protein
LHVDAIVEGSVVRSADRVRVNVQLIHAATDRHLWARSYEEAFVDVVRLQNRVANAIAEEIQAKLTSLDRARFASAHAVNPQAYEMYLKGRYHWNKRTESELRLGLRYFEQAVDVDPKYAYGYVGLADTYNILGSWVFNAVPPADAGRKAEEYARRALALDPSLGEAHAALGDAKFLFERNWDVARQEFELAIALAQGSANAHHWFGEYLCDTGQFDRAIEESRKALALDPLAPILGIALGGRLHIAGRDDEALEALRNALELDPNIPLLRSTLGQVYESKGMFPEAVGEFERAIELSHGDPNYIANLVHVYGVSGDTAWALQTLNTLKSLARTRVVPAFDFAVAYMGVNDRRSALRALKAAYDQGSTWLDNIAVEPRFSSLRSEAEFVQIVRALGLPILPPDGRFATSR